MSREKKTERKLEKKDRTFVGNLSMISKLFFFFYSSIKTEEVLFFLVGKCRFSNRANYMFFFFFIKCSISKGNALGMFHL